MNTTASFRLAILFGLTLLALAGPLALADTLTLKPVADTTLFQNDPDNNLGNAWLAAGTTKLNQKSRAVCSAYGSLL